MSHDSQAANKFRFIFAILIPVVIVILTVGFFVQQFNADIEFTHKEIEGVHEVRSFYQHLQIAQRIRGLRQLKVGGHIGLEKEIESLHEDLVDKINNSKQESHADWLKAKDKLEDIRIKIENLYSIHDIPPDSLALFDSYSKINLDFIVLIKQVADSSNLTFDPELDSHLLKELAVDRLPLIIEHIAMMRGLTAFIAQQPQQFSAVLPRLQFRMRALSNERAYIDTRYDEYLLDNTTVAELKDDFDSMLVSVDAYIEYMQAGIANKGYSTLPLDVFEKGSRTVKIAMGLAEKTNSKLMERLIERSKRHEGVKLKIIFGISLATLFFIGLVIYYFYSNRKAHESLVVTRKALASAQSRNTAIIDTVVDGIISIDQNGIVHNFNPSAENIFGYRADEVLGENINILMPEPYSIEHDGYLDNFLTTGHKKIIGIGREVEGKRKDGTVFPLDLAVNEMQIDGQRFFTGIVRDITDRKRVETMKNEFISTVSHELRTPLTSIRGSLGLVSGGAVGDVPDKVKELLTIAGNNTERLLVLINDILDLQKIESGKMAFKFKIMDVIPLVEQSVENNKAYADQYGVNFEINQYGEDLKVFGDLDRLMQVVTNLLSNAAKFSPQGSTVQISVARHDGSIRVAVTDNGPGIPVEFRHRIFEKFSQSDASDTKVKGGTGLGLSISKLIIEKHGGRIDYLTKEDIGTTFYFELPELAGKEAAREPVIRDNMNEHVPCVLIVEDDQDVAALLRRMLAEVGFDSDVAYSAEEARDLLEKNIIHYQIMTLDIILPDEDGLSLLQSMREDPKTRDLPVVIVSAKADEGKIELNGGAVGVMDWLSKPIDQNRLVNIIQQVAAPNALPRVLHVEDDEDIHKIVGLMLQGTCELVWTMTVEASRQVLMEEHVDLVLLDIELPDGSGLELLDTIEHHVNPPRVVIFSANEVPSEYVSRVNAILTKSGTGNDELLKNILGFIKK